MVTHQEEVGKIVVVAKSFARFKDLLGGEVLVNIAKGASVRDLLETLCTTEPSLRESIFESDGNLKEEVTLLWNRKGISQECLDSVLAEGDELAILPPFSGG